MIKKTFRRIICIVFTAVICMMMISCSDSMVIGEDIQYADIVQMELVSDEEGHEWKLEVKQSDDGVHVGGTCPVNGRMLDYDGIIQDETWNSIRKSLSGKTASRPGSRSEPHMILIRCRGNDESLILDTGEDGFETVRSYIQLCFDEDIMYSTDRIDCISYSFSDGYEGINETVSVYRDEGKWVGSISTYRGENLSRNTYRKILTEEDAGSIIRMLNGYRWLPMKELPAAPLIVSDSPEKSLTIHFTTLATWQISNGQDLSDDAAALMDDIADYMKSKIKGKS